MIYKGETDTLHLLDLLIDELNEEKDELSDKNKTERNLMNKAYQQGQMNILNSVAQRLIRLRTAL